MDPRVSMMMRAMVASVSHVSEKLERSQRRAAEQGHTRANRIILNMRRRIVEPVLLAWAELVRSKQAIGRRAARCALHSSPVGRSAR